MTERMLRPPYLLVHPADAAGCGTHRIMRPLEMLTKMGIAAGRADMGLWPADRLKVLNPNVVVWQRQHEDGQIETMKAYREALPEAFIVYELDDALGAVPEESFHRAYIPVDVEERIALAVKQCDAVSVSTRALAAYMRRICGEGTDVRVVPNMLGKDDFATAAGMRAAHKKPHFKPRIGWGGGISHTGDLALIKDVVVATAPLVEWVFLGMQPDVGIPVEFHQGVPPREYLAKLASLDLDLVVAPIEDNLFNRCKSNLRLIEAGACGYGVIASPVEPYLEKSPPVAYANTTAEWIEAIRSFSAEGWEARAHERGAKMRQWAEKHFCFETNGEERLKGWLPKGAKPFRSDPKPAASSTLTILCSSPPSGLEFSGIVVTDAAEAYASGNDILYVRPAAIFQRDAVERLVGHLAKLQTASVSALSNDGGICGFPRFGEFSQIDVGHGQELDKICSANFAGLDLDIPFPNGPLILLSRRAINACGAPEIGPPGSEEEMLVRWGTMVSARGYRNKVAPDCYATALLPNNMQLSQIVQNEMLRWPPVNIPSDPLPDVRARLEIEFFKAFFKSPLRQQNSSYEDWAAYFDSPGERDIQAMRQQAAKIERPTPFGILVGGEFTVEPQAWLSYWHVSRETWAEAHVVADEHSVEWLIFMQPGAVLRSHALFMFAAEIAAHPEARFIYADHDTLTLEGTRTDHQFKPNFDRDLLLGRDYVSQICAIKRDVIGHREGKIDDVAVYAMALELLGDDPEGIRHIPRILAHLPPSNAQHELRKARRKIAAANASLACRGIAATVSPHPRYPQWGEVSYRAPEAAPLVSIIIPTKDKVEMLSPCIATVLEMTTYPNYEVLIIDNGSTRPQMVDFLNTVRGDPRVRVIAWPFPYNWSALNNFAAGEAKGEYLCLLNDDTRIVEPRWLDEMVGAARPGVGAVGARLIYPHSLVQHVGVFCMHGYCGHSLKGLPDGAAGYQGFGVLSHDCTAVTGACMLIKRELFDGAGRLDETLVHNFNDVALCLQLNRMGYRNVLAAKAVLQHYEGVTRTNAMSPEGLRYLQQEADILCNKFPEPDPYWNPNLLVTHQHGGALVTGLGYDQISWPGQPWPWRGADWQQNVVLTIGDNGQIQYNEMAQGDIVYRAQIDGYSVRFVEPELLNVPPCDIRNPAVFKVFMDQIGISRVVLGSLAGIPIETLGFIERLGVPIDYVPDSAESICPRRDFMVNGKNCAEGWRNGACQDCVDRNGSPAGFVSVAGWLHLFSRFLNRAELDTSRLGDETGAAIVEFHSGSSESLRLPRAG